MILRCTMVVRGAYRIKATPGITEWFRPSVHSGGGVRYLDVGSAHPGGVEAPKGWSVRPLKRYVSWVQNVVRQLSYKIYIADNELSPINVFEPAK